MTSSRLIRGDNALAELSTWTAPDVVCAPPRGSKAELEKLEREAEARGFESGRSAGMAAATADIERRADTLETVLDALTRPFTNLDHRIEEELLALIQTITQQLVRRELHLDPTHIVGVIREGLAALPASAEEIVVRLHPDDADVVRECLRQEEESQPWLIATDPVMQRGGCEIETRSSVIDARIETRLGNVIATMFEDERTTNV